MKKRNIKEDFESLCSVACGDIVVASSKSDLLQCQKVLKNMIKDKQIRDYLGDYNKKKIMYPPNYIN